MTWLLELIGTLAGSAFIRTVITRAVIALGFSLVTYAGVAVGVATVWSAISTNFSALPVNVVTILTMMKIPNALNVIISAYMGSLAVRGLTAGGVIKRAVWAPGNGTDVL